MLTKRGFLIVLPLLFVMISCSNGTLQARQEQKTEEAVIEHSGDNEVKVEANDSKAFSAQVVVYYFHTTYRCFSCHKIEQYTKEAVEEYFKDKLTSGKLVFKPVNVDKKENKHFINDYQLYTKSVILSLVKDGKEVKYNNLAKVWHYFGNKQQFFNYIKSEVNKYLEEIP